MLALTPALSLRERAGVRAPIEAPPYSDTAGLEAKRKVRQYPTMSNRGFREALEEIAREDPRYAGDAYVFVCEALQHTSSILDKPKEGPDRHVSGGELLEGIRSYAIQQFGPMTMTVLKSWGITDTANFGDVVFNMVDRGILGKTGHDKPEDFIAGYQFNDAFVLPFLPVSKR